VAGGIVVEAGDDDVVASALPAPPEVTLEGREWARVWLDAEVRCPRSKELRRPKGSETRSLSGTRDLQEVRVYEPCAVLIGL
jgi:hypothetical protein